MPSARQHLGRLCSLLVLGVCCVVLHPPAAAEVSGDAKAPAVEAEKAAPATDPAPTTSAARDSNTLPKNTLDDVPSYAASLINMVIVLVAILIGMILLARLLPRWIGRLPGAGRGDTIKVVDSLALEARKRIYLVKVGQQHFLIGTSESGVHMLSDRAVDPGAPPASASGVSAAGETTGVAATQSPAMRTFAAALSGQGPAAARTTEGAR